MTQPDDPGDVAEQIREAVAGQLVDDRLPDPVDLRQRFPGQEATIDRVLRAALDLQALQRDLTRSKHAAPHLQPGTRLGEFTIMGPLAEGGMGRVYRARQESVGDRAVALKVVAGGAGDATGQAQRMARLRQEAAAAGRLHHPNLAEVYGCGEAGGVTFYAMRLVEGPTLEAVLRRLRGDHMRAGRWNRRLVDRVAEVASALAAVHDAGLVHGDVKPGNVVLEGGDGDEIVPNRPAVLVDFGLAAAAGADGSPEGVRATLAYAAPEVLRGHAPDRRTDVFSLGATLHDLLAARLPGERFEAAVGLEPLTGLAAGVDPDLAAVVAKAVDPLPEWRYRDAGELHADLAAWLRGDAVGARRPVLVQAARRAVRKRPWAAAAVGGAGLLLVLGVATAAQGIGAGLRSLSAAERAMDRGDTQALGDELLRLQDSLVARWLMPERMRRQAEPLWTGGTGALAQVYFHQRAGERTAASHAAAEHLIEGRAAADPLYFEYFAWELRSGDPERRAAAALAASRCFMHAADLSPAATAQSAPCRAALLDLVFDPATSGSTRLYGLAALSGCGEPASIEPLLEFASHPERSAEERRLASNAIGDILFRALPCGLLPKAGESPGFVARALEFLEAARDPAFRMDSTALHPVIQGLVILRRDLGEVPVDMGPHAELHDALLDDHHWNMVQAVARDPRIREVLSREPGALDPSSISSWATDVRSFDDPAVTAAASAACRRLKVVGACDFDVVKRFEDAFEEQDAKLDTRKMASVETSSRSGSMAPAEIATRRSDGPWCDLCPRLARWDLSAADVTILGSAKALTGANVGFRGEEFGRPASQTHWRLLPGGEAELTFWFEIDAGLSAAYLEVVLQHQVGGRNEVPGRGAAVVSVALDGDTVYGDYPVLAHVWLVDRFRLPVAALLPGEHRVTVALKPWSTSTYWIRSAGVVKGR